MTLTRYSKWVEASNHASESPKLDAFVSQSEGNKGEVGKAYFTSPKRKNPSKINLLGF